MNRRLFLSRGLTGGLISTVTMLAGGGWIPGAKALAVGSTAQLTAEFSGLKVFRSPTCGCCGKWLEKMEAAGFQVQDNITKDMTAIKQRYGVPEDLASCHTAIASGYVIEGHVPATDIQRLLAEKPPVVGITAPGMPTGSPGMEVGNRVDPYTVFSFTKVGEPVAFAEH
ncbi:MAG: DUF411 domain-containing protein [Leptolyngbyaceae cyanobacterium SM2_3_12]|nr:DUF411 domain-containing protein [Leptolyngbyaceae cyanobacterium SM2_3_12]